MGAPVGLALVESRKKIASQVVVERKVERIMMTAIEIVVELDTTAMGRKNKVPLTALFINLRGPTPAVQSAS